MAIPTIKCKNCDHIFSLEMKEDGITRWYEIDADHGCQYEMIDPFKTLPEDLPGVKPKPDRADKLIEMLRRGE